MKDRISHRPITVLGLFESRDDLVMQRTVRHHHALHARVEAHPLREVERSPVSVGHLAARLFHHERTGVVPDVFNVPLAR
eukprot:CAMPEP_0182534356 /NCGR_PEP_ID=MMETSP1323-20130603/15588_1 /TAXON_ID=236787 /ORGANISM="Florenciella parvula, Strain RCC1693" /LENGTH=79 /DNA_ID=CAMNT_0024744363 /DNA_START=40 /DNA_END=279 /DNA_ORIENTATION=+